MCAAAPLMVTREASARQETVVQGLLRRYVRGMLGKAFPYRDLEPIRAGGSSTSMSWVLPWEDHGVATECQRLEYPITPKGQGPAWIAASLLRVPSDELRTVPYRRRGPAVSAIGAIPSPPVNRGIPTDGVQEDIWDYFRKGSMLVHERYIALVGFPARDTKHLHDGTVHEALGGVLFQRPCRGGAWATEGVRCRADHERGTRYRRGSRTPSAQGGMRA